MQSVGCFRQIGLDKLELSGWYISIKDNFKDGGV